MFEQAVLCPAPVRRWAVTLGFAGQLGLVACLLAIPLVWPQVLSRHEVLSWITAPLPPPPVIRETTTPHMRAVRRPIREGAIWFPIHVVPQPAVMFDEPPVSTPSVAGGSASNAPPFIFDSVIRIEPPKRPAAPASTPAPKSAPAPVQQIRVSGPVQAARLIHRVDPLYPPLARQVRISGTVELAGVIGVDGRIRELRVTSGHPLLVRAALEAVRQWVYQPTSLGANPVEVLTTISVVFQLN